MSYNYANDAYYDPSKKQQFNGSNGQYGLNNSSLDFASAPMTEINGTQQYAGNPNQQFYDPGSFFSLPNDSNINNVNSNNMSFNTNASNNTFFSDWSQPNDQFYNPQDYQSANSNDVFGGGNGAAMGGQHVDFENEPPLLEELGINFDHIYRKTFCVLNPISKPHESIIHDDDLAGPLVFCIAYGFSLLLMGKIQFGFIYGVAALGCICMYSLLNLMCEKGTSVVCVSSTLGYCLLPMVIHSFLSIVIPVTGIAQLIFTLIFIFWCSVSASKLFVISHNMANQQILVLYPCFLLYGIFAILNAF